MQLQSSQRPWVAFKGPGKVDFGVAESTAGEAKSVLNLAFTYQLENPGNSPARKITIPSFIPAATIEFKPPEGWEKKHCDFAEKMSGENYFTQVLMPKADTGPATARAMGGSVVEVSKIKFVWVLGCVVYKDTLDGPIHHSSTLILWANYAGKNPSDFWLYDSDAD